MIGHIRVATKAAARLLIIGAACMAFAFSASFAQVPAIQRGAGLDDPSSSVDRPSTDVPRTMTYQGMITTPDGKPVQDGSYKIIVHLYSDAAGTQEIWSDEYVAPVVGGVFNLSLGGGGKQLPVEELNRPIWVGTQIGDEKGIAGDAPVMKPLSALSAAPYALAIPNKSVTAEKMATDYVGSISLNGQKISGRGQDVNLITGNGITATVDPGTNAILLQAATSNATSANNKESGGKGAEAQANTTVTGNLTVVQNTFFNTGLDGSSHTTSTTIGSNSASNPGVVNLQQGISSGGHQVILQTPSGSMSGDATVTLPGSSGTLVLQSRSIGAGTGLSGGGDLSADRTISLDVAHANTWISVQSLPSSAAQGNNLISAINAGNSGTINTSELSSLVTAQGNSFNGASQLVRLDSVGRLPALNGSSLTNLSAGNVTGTLSNNTIGTASNVTGTVSIAHGGTGANTANNALNALLPPQDSNSGKVLRTDGTNTSWVAGGGGGAVSSVFTRTGGIVAQTGDYSFSQISGTASIAHGGTGATSADSARANLGLGTLATQNASNLNLSGTAVTQSIVPNADNVYSLGSAAFRFKNLFLGPNTLTISDSSTITSFDQAPCQYCPIGDSSTITKALEIKQNGVTEMVLSTNGNMRLRGTLQTDRALMPSTDLMASLGDASHRFKDLFLGAHSLTISDSSTITSFDQAPCQYCPIGDSSTITKALEIKQNGVTEMVLSTNGNMRLRGTLQTDRAIMPSTDLMASLGDASHRFKDLFLGAHSLTISDSSTITSFDQAPCQYCPIGDSSTITKALEIKQNGVTEMVLSTNGNMRLRGTLQTDGTMMSASAVISGNINTQLASGVIHSGGAGTNLSTSLLTTADIANGAVTNVKLANGTLDLTTKVTNVLPLVNGGTGASDAGTARTNLGLGTMATQNANGVAITGGSIDGTTVGQTAPAAGTFTNLQGINMVTVGSSTQQGVLKIWDVAALMHFASITLNNPGANVNYTIPGAPDASSFVMTNSSQAGQTISNGLTVNGGLTLGTALAATNGGTGLTSSTGTQFLRGNGSGAWTSGAIQSGDLPSLSASYINNSTSLQSGANFNVSGSGQVGGNLLLSDTGTPGQLQLQGTGRGTSTFQAGAQDSTTINYTLPIARPTANQVLTATAVSGSGPYAVTTGWASAGGPLFAKKSADQNYSSTTLVNDSHLALSLAANATYTFEGFLSFEDTNSDVSSGAKVAFTVPTLATLKFGVNSAAGVNSSNTASVSSTSGTAVTGVLVQNAHAGDETFLCVKGIVITGSNSGNLQLQCAKGNGTTLRLHRNSYLTATRVQ